MHRQYSEDSGVGAARWWGHHREMMIPIARALGGCTTHVALVPEACRQRRLTGVHDPEKEPFRFRERAPDHLDRYRWLPAFAATCGRLAHCAISGFSRCSGFGLSIQTQVNVMTSSDVTLPAPRRIDRATDAHRDGVMPRTRSASPQRERPPGAHHRVRGRARPVGAEPRPCRSGISRAARGPTGHVIPAAHWSMPRVRRPCNRLGARYDADA
jgi:hypothetical protein